MRALRRTSKQSRKPAKLWLTVRYAVAAMQRHLEAGHKRLPLVIPILFYAGRRTPSPYSTRWLDEFDDPLLADRLYSHSFPLVDVTTIPDDEIMQHRSMAAVTLLQKHIRQRDLAELMDRLVSILMAGDHSSSQVISLINYIVQVGEGSDAKNRTEEHTAEIQSLAYLVCCLLLEKKTSHSG